MSLLQQTGSCKRFITPLPTPSTCTICRDLLLEYKNDKSKDLQPIVSIKCGHLFHTSCINGWFQKSQDTDDPTLRHCPLCWRLMRQYDIKRIFTVNVGCIYRKTDDGARRPAPSICARLCGDYVLEHDFQGEYSTPNLRPIVATKCGHLFHTSCLNKWFDGEPTRDPLNPKLKSCPHCNRLMRRCDIQRILPVSSGEE